MRNTRSSGLDLILAGAWGTRDTCGLARGRSPLYRRI